MTNAEKLIQEKYNNIHPICGCGCGEKTVYDHNSKDFGKFKRGHQTRVNPNYFGDPKNPKRVEKIISTRKQKFVSGEYDHVKEAIKKNRKDPKLGEKISKGAKGIPKPKPEGFGLGRKHSKKTKEKMSDSAVQRIIKTGKVKRSLLEIRFELFFQLLNIEFQHSYYINTKENHFIYDFYLPKHKCLIEVDGDFWHCNPDTKYALPECKTQDINVLNDQKKNQWAQDNGFKLLRFWETDINTNPQQIIEILKQELT
jgi:very-short-patch-repair endonuclease